MLSLNWMLDPAKSLVDRLKELALSLMGFRFYPALFCRRLYWSDQLWFLPMTHFLQQLEHKKLLWPFSPWSRFRSLPHQRPIPFDAPYTKKSDLFHQFYDWDSTLDPWDLWHPLQKDYCSVQTPKWGNNFFLYTSSAWLIFSSAPSLVWSLGLFHFPGIRFFADPLLHFAANMQQVILMTLPLVVFSKTMKISSKTAMSKTILYPVVLSKTSGYNIFDVLLDIFSVLLNIFHFFEQNNIQLRFTRLTTRFLVVNSTPMNRLPASTWFFCWQESAHLFNNDEPNFRDFNF